MLVLSKDKRQETMEQRNAEIAALMKEIDELSDKLAVCDKAQTNMLTVQQRLKDIEATIDKSRLTQFDAEIFKSLIDEVAVGRLALTFRFRCGISLTHDLV